MNAIRKCSIHGSDNGGHLIGEMSLSGIYGGRCLEVRPYPHELARRHEHKQALRSARRDEIIAQLLAIKLDLLGTGS